ncbi:MAG: ATP-binding protein [Alphaproteobacteria bacterium]
MRHTPARSATTLGRLRRNIIILGAVFVAIILVGSTATVMRTHKRAIDQAERNAQNLVSALQEHAGGAFQAVDMALADMVFDAETMGLAQTAHGAAWRRALAAKDELLPQVKNIALIDSSGGLLAESTSPGDGRNNFFDRPYFAFHRDNPSKALHIGVPLQSVRTGTWFIPVSRRIDRPDGSFGGVAVAIVDPAYFGEFYRSLDIGAGGTVWIFNRERQLLVREPALPELYVQGYKAKTIGEALDDAPAGTFIAPSPVDGVERIMSYRSVSDVPIVVAIGVPLDVALVNWRRDTSLRATVIVAILALVTALVYALIRNLAVAQRAHDAQARLYEAIEGMSEAIVLYDADERFVMCNTSHRAIYPETAHLNQPGAAYEDILRAWVETGRLRLPPGMAREDFIQTRLRQFRHPGEPVDVQQIGDRWMQISERSTPDGGLIRVATDITALKKQQEMLSEARDAAEASNRTKSLFLANMSHELRTPLHAILGLSEIIRDQPGLEAPVPEYGKMIHDSGQHLLTLINDILDMSKIEAGRYELVEDTVVLSELAQSCLTITSTRANMAGVNLENKVPAALPPVRADARALKQVLLNLLSNAVKFTPAGGYVTLSAALEPDGSMALRVADTGVGIAAEDLGRVAEPFWQGDPSHARKYGGTGLGLSISKHLILLHDGAMQVESAVGRGTTVTVRLPKDRVIEAAARGLLPRA